MRYSRDTLDRWIRRYRAGGFAEQVPGWAPSESTDRLELIGPAAGDTPAVFGRFAAEHPMSAGPGTLCTARESNLC